MSSSAKTLQPILSPSWRTPAAATADPTVLKKSGTFAAVSSNYDLRTDEELLRELRRGQEEPLVELYRRHQKPLYRFALNMTGSPEIAQEAVQDAFLALIRRPESWQAEKGTVLSFL